jgi:hypothetical protein
LSSSSQQKEEDKNYKKGGEGREFTFKLERLPLG